MTLISNLRETTLCCKNRKVITFILIFIWSKSDPVKISWFFKISFDINILHFLIILRDYHIDLEAILVLVCNVLYKEKGYRSFPVNVLEIDKPTYQWLIVYSNYITFQEIECSVPILDRKLVVSPIKEKYRVGDLLEFSCHSGHRVGPDSVQCYHFGWSPGFPTCKGQYVFYIWSIRIRSFFFFF